ncbi:hypothetical protein GGS23DRAFT_612382 [Durotheca rogersii]|uniref:uncharacterized protein n=1 Tax=Durotheca rogersii TaxID=419775 RepID=UPI002220CE0E|nr:uncharacterized protein GGS23DRAFT_612382 [Durotheca rogersii]KAI5867262.1 hypothetical protein GGS23DRAFT_612382 [Durotheca rogersii]
MASSQEIRASNALINDATAPRVAVFVGGTSGIGKLTIRALVATGASVRIYLVGRPSAGERARAFIRELRAANPRAEVVWTEAEVALLGEVGRVCEAIRAAESRVDLLFLSAGYAPLGAARAETAERVEVAQSLEYYSRVLFALRLLPLLRAAAAPRVVSVLAGGLERRAAVDLDDLDLRRPGRFGGVRAQPQYAAMNTVALDKLAADNPGVTFVHSWPGWVDTGNVRRGSDPNSLWAWFVWLVLEPLIRLLAISDDESGQRHLFQSTSAAFGGRGVPWKGKPGINSLGQPADGLFLANYKCDCTPNVKVVSWLREKAAGKIWDHTQEVLRPYL